MKAAEGAKRRWQRFRQLPRRLQLVALLGVVLVALVAFGTAVGSNSRPNVSVSRGLSSTTTSLPVTLAPTTSSTLPAATSPTQPTTAQPTTAQPTTTAEPTTSADSTATPAAPAVHPPGTCHARGSGLTSLPDPTCTPGATNPAVTQATIRSTICVSGWTSTVRPSEAYTDDLKITQMAAYGFTGPTSSYEEDHLIPLELGGSPSNALNLWPEPGGSPNAKDQVENAAHRDVCDGSMTLAAAQQAIATNWVAFAGQLGIGTSPTTAAPTTTAATAPAPSTTPTTSGTVSNYRAGEFCPKTMLDQIVQTPSGSLICKVTTDPDHPRWAHV